MGMTELSLFTGGGGGVWASKLLGHRIVGYVERDEYCQKIIRQRIRDGHFDDAPIFPDVRTFDGLPYRGRVDLVSAGFPCQPFSVAGKRAGGDDERNCWPDTVRVLGEVRPRFALLENVSGLLACGYFGTILSDLAALGYSVRWECISASDVGAPHERRRLWILAYPAGELPSRRRELGTGRRSKSSDRRESMAYTDSEREQQQEGSELEIGRRIGDGGKDVANTAEFGSVERRRKQFSACGEGAGHVHFWVTEPDVGRVANGVASRGHKLRALGNGQVPAVAVRAWRLLTKEINQE